ncbi:MAG: RNA methyltransferase [Rhodobacteraceae bacterium]|nr:RNA methyltransferase [Paracoccaceae bacterium]
MSGTDHGQDGGLGGPQPVMVLVRPQMGENIGAAARAMWNFGLERMRLVAPRDGWPNSKAVAMASGAGRVLDQVVLADDTAGAIGDLDYVLATTARSRDLTKPVLTPERAMQETTARIAAGQKVGILFGPERAGLENTDIARANAVIAVPVNPAFGSLNLAQCVLLLAYEWRRQGPDMPPGQSEMREARPANAIEVERLFERLMAALEPAGFFWPEDKAESMALNLRNLLSRMPLTEADIRMLHGVVRALAGKEAGE